MRTPTAAARSAMFIFAVALLARLALMVGLYASPQPGLARFWDTGLEVGHVAESLVTGSGFASPFGGHTGPSAMLPPAYPLLVATVFRLLGPFSTASAWAVLVLHCVFSALTCVVISCIGKTTFGEPTGAVAAWLWAVCPSSMLLPVFRFWDTSLGTLLFATSFLALLQAGASRDRLPWLYWGALTGVSALVNPALLVCLLALGAWVWYSRNQRSVPTWPSALLAVIVLAAVLAPWTIRNYFAFHQAIPLRSNFGMELWIGNHEAASGDLQAAWHPATDLREFESYQRAGEVAYFRQKRDQGLEFIQQHPSAFLRLSLRRVERFWTAGGELWGLAAFSLPLVAVGLAGLGRLIVARAALAVLYAIPVVIYPLPFYLTHAAARYRHPLEPLLFVLGANVVMNAIARVKLKRGGAPGF